MNKAKTLQVLSSAERNSLLALSAYERLTDLGLTTIARDVWVIYLGASESAETMGETLGVEVHVL
jgi:hypothetical protein